MPGWNGFDVRRRFEQHFDAPVWVDNDVNLLAYGERARRRDEDLDLIYCKIGSGIGAGLLSRGQIHRGANGAAGDIGHVRVADLESVQIERRDGALVPIRRADAVTWKPVPDPPQRTR
jgi:predicted NBD/HSP70 family sugar kinase